MDNIKTVETEYKPLPNTAAAEWAVRLHWSRRDVDRFRPDGIAPEVVASAVVNHGRWIVRCPFCASAQLAAKSDHRFFCVDCLNEAVGRRFVQVQWPTPAQQQKIESALLLRPRAENANWEQGETIADLHRENVAHGLKGGN